MDKTVTAHQSSANQLANTTMLKISNALTEIGDYSQGKIHSAGITNDVEMKEEHEKK